MSTIDQTASRDEAVKFVFNCAMIAMHLSRWAEQWIIYSTTEFSFIKIVDKYTTGGDYSAWVIRHRSLVQRWLNDHPNWKPS